MAKHIALFGTASNTAGETINEGSQSPISDDRSRYSRMNVVLDVQALTGTSPTITVSIQEQFGSIWVETAKSTAISATGQYVLCQHALPNTQASKNQGAFPALGSGSAKRAVTTIGGTQVSAVTTDIYFGFFD